ncbi:MAG: hypothetical protein EZS28_019779 [Streblomastix strix]|uniref:Uncharacterized protein n=1 Tax=Streblomastix strix TaxID=222440 RepID=A0A5J4VQ51_9EUKA|nr:MAG: hypothetical protein EZS28_019779 [Streblomastix strix]
MTAIETINETINEIINESTQTESTQTDSFNSTNQGRPKKYTDKEYAMIAAEEQRKNARIRYKQNQTNYVSKSKVIHYPHQFLAPIQRISSAKSISQLHQLRISALEVYFAFSEMVKPGPIQKCYYFYPIQNFSLDPDIYNSAPEVYLAFSEMVKPGPIQKLVILAELSNLFGILLIIDIIWIVYVHVWGHFYLSRNRRLTASAISRTIVYDEIPIIGGCCFCNYQRSYTIPFEDIAKVSHQIEERNNQIQQLAVFELKNGGYFTPDVDLSQSQYNFIKKLMKQGQQQRKHSNQQQDDHSESSSDSSKSSSDSSKQKSRYAPPKTDLQQAPIETREKQASNLKDPYQVQQQQQIQPPIEQKLSQSSEQQDQLPVQSNLDQNEGQVENKEIDDKKNKKEKKQKKMKKEGKEKQKHSKSKNLKNKSNSHKTKKEKDNQNVDQVAEVKQSTDKVDDPKDVDQQQTHTGLESDSIEEAQDV